MAFFYYNEQACGASEWSCSGVAGTYTQGTGYSGETASVYGPQRYHSGVNNNDQTKYVYNIIRPNGTYYFRISCTGPQC